MQVGTAGVPYDLATQMDFDAIFAQMKAAGQSLIMPYSIYEQIPEVKATGLEAAFFPPPWGTAGPEFYDAMDRHGIKMIVPASLLYPDGKIPSAQTATNPIIESLIALGRPDLVARFYPDAVAPPQPDPLVDLLEAVGGRDVIAGFYTYDEPVLHEVPNEWLKAFYGHVKSLAPELPVMQVHAPIEAGWDANAYLAQVHLAAKWADQVGFAVYGSDLPGAGHQTPYSNGAVVDRVTAVGDYMRWMEQAMPDKLTLGVLQGFGLKHVYSDEALAQLDPAMVEAADAPSIFVMSEMARALGNADTVIWFGPSYLDGSSGATWQNVLDISESIERPIGQLGDEDPAANSLLETAGADSSVGIDLGLDGDLGANATYSVDDDRFGVTADGSVYLKQAGTIDHQTEPEITLIGSARLDDGRIATQAFKVTVVDVADQISGTSQSEELIGTGGGDSLFGLGGDDYIWGRGGNDRLDGGSGADVLLGEAGRDTLSGGSGDDNLLGGADNDTLTGGDGADTFIFSRNEGFDTITDFVLGVDKIALVGKASYGISAFEGSALVQFDGTEILVQGVPAVQLSEADFYLLDSLV